MKIQTLRIPEEIVQEISQIAVEIGESKQTVFRLSIKEGLPFLRKRLGIPELTLANEQRKPLMLTDRK